MFSMKEALLAVVILAAQTHGDGIPSGWPQIEVESPFRVYATDDRQGCEIPATKANRMIEAGYTKVACPFGSVLIGATNSYPNEYLLFGANVLANILDRNSDGVADDPAVVAELSYKNNYEGAMLQCGASQQEEERGDEMLGDVFDYAFSCQTWHAWYYGNDSPLLQQRTFKGVMMEEAFHMVHQNGYARVYPDELGMDDFTSSVVGREMARLQCADPGWIHPENRCPGGPPRDPDNDPPLTSVPGTCNYPSCNIAEFYKMVLFLLIGMGSDNDPSGPEVWLSYLMPGGTEDVEAMVSDDFKAMIVDPRLHQLQAPLTGEYRVGASPTPAPIEPTPAPVQVTRAPKATKKNKRNKKNAKKNKRRN